MAALTEIEIPRNEYGDFEAEIDNFSVEEELPLFLNSVLDRADAVINANSRHINEVEACLTVVDRTISLLGLIRQEVDEDDRQEWYAIESCFTFILQNLHSHMSELARRPTTLTMQSCNVEHTRRPGRPAFHVQPEMLEKLLGLGFSKEKIAKMYGVSRWTIYRRIQEYNLLHLSEFSNLSDAEIDEVLRDYTSRHGRTTGEVLIMGYLRSRGIHLQRRRVRNSMARIDPENAALRWGAAVYRRRYQVPWANSLWHLDGHHSLIRWGLVIHGCIDGFSRRRIYLHCSSNNLASTVLTLFLDAIEKDGELWPSRIRVDHGVENVLVCEAMVEARGEGRASFIAGPSTHNQRIERLWRDVFRTVSHYFYYVFYAMEDSGILNTTNPLHVFALHIVFLPRINLALQEFVEAYNQHKVRTMHNWSPYQVWINSILNADNPLLPGQPDPLPENAEFYGFDPHGPNPFDESDNDVVVHPINIENATDIQSEILQVVNPLAPSNEMGIDIYEEVLNLLQIQ
ncbi:hypothetical protein AWC38_SpisGene3841 [Paramuricea clavata]|uniref:Uncharacterized protein n=1 Tax=Paramuricea clavata TaxID=317549 RepID=A0A7D9EBK5_PARCT|nr:hypothetical protein AWC38_SpisGene3841 [Paramuricea clavata]